MIHEWAGFSSFVLDPCGPHRIGVTVKDMKFLKLLDNCLTKDMVTDYQPWHKFYKNEDADGNTDLKKKKEEEEEEGEEEEGTNDSK